MKEGHGNEGGDVRVKEGHGNEREGLGELKVVSLKG